LDPEICIQRARQQIKALNVTSPRPSSPAVAALISSLPTIPATADVARIAIIQALGRSKDPAVLRAFLIESSARAKEIRKSVAAALGDIRHPLSAYLLLPMLRDGSSRVRHAAMRSLIAQRQPQTTEAVVATCLSSASLRATAIESVQSLSKSGKAAFAECLGLLSFAGNTAAQTVAQELFGATDVGSRKSSVPSSRDSAAETTAVFNDSRLAARGAHHGKAFEDDPRGSRDIHSRQTPFPSSPAASLSATSTASMALDLEAMRNELDSAASAAIQDDGEQMIAGLFPGDDDDDHDEAEDGERPFTGSSDSIADMQFFASIDLEEEVPLQQSTMNRADRVSVSSKDETLSGARLQTSSSEIDVVSSVSGMLKGTAVAAMPMMPPSASPDLTASSPLISAIPDLSVSSPLIPAFSVAAFASPLNPQHRAASSDIVPGLNGSGAYHTATSDLSHSTLVTMPPGQPHTLSSLSAAVQLDPEEAELLARAAHERSLQRLRIARDAAFRIMLENQEDISGPVPRLLSRKIGTLLAISSTDIENVKLQLLKIGKTGSPAALETLSTYCQKPAKEIRLACAQALGKISHQRSAALLLKLLGDKSGTVVEAAVTSLISVNVDCVRGVILAAGLVTASLKTIVTSEIEAASEESKSQWEQFLLTTLNIADPELLALSVSLLSRITGAVHYDLYEKLVQNDSALVRAASVDALVRTEEKRAMSLINEALLDPDPRVRAQAASAIARFHSPRSIELLCRLLLDPDLSVRQSAAQTAARIQDEGLSDAIASALNQESDVTTIEYLLAAVSRNGANGALSILTSYIEDDTSEFREQALKALKKLKAPESTPVFQRLLDDRNPSIRRQSVEQLALLKVESVIPRIREMLRKDPDECVRGICARALGEFQDKSSLQLLEDALEDHPVVQLQAVIALGRLNQASAGPVLLSLLRNPQPEIRYQAVKALGQLKLEGTEESIALILDDRDEMVRRGAEQALQDLGQSLRTIRVNRFRKQFVSVASKLMPSSLAGAIPGGTKSLLTVVLMLTAVLGYWGLSNARFVIAGGEQLPAGRVIGVGISASTGTADILRTKGVLDVWSVSDGKLIARVRVPSSAMGVISEEKGGVILLMGNELGRLNPESEFSSETMQTLKLTRPNSSLFFHQKTNSLCIFEITGGTTTLRVVDAATLQETQSFSINAPFAGIVSPDFSIAAKLDSDGVLMLCDLKSGELVTGSVTEITGQRNLGAVSSISFTDDMKYVGFCASGGFVALRVDNLRFEKLLPSPDANGFVSAQSIPDTSDFVVMSASGIIYELSDNLKTVKESKVERSVPFNLSAMGAGGELVVFANTDFYDFDVFSIKQQKTILANSPEE